MHKTNIILSLAAVLSLSCVLHAQAASYSIVDRSGTCPTAPSSFVVGPKALSLPKIGTIFRVEVPRGYGGSGSGSSILMTGIQRMSFNMNLGHCSGGPTKVIGCGIMLMIPLAFQVSRHGYVDTSIPNSTMLLGTRFYQQVMYSASGCSSVPGGSCTLPRCYHNLYLGPLALGIVGT